MTAALRQRLGTAHQTAAGPKTYQFAATADECATYRKIRQLNDDSSKLRLQQTLHLDLHAGSRHIGRYTVEGNKLFSEFVIAGAWFLDKLSTEPLPEDGSADSQLNDAGPILSPQPNVGDSNPSSGTASIPENTNACDTNYNPMAFDEILDDPVPSYDKIITQNISEEVPNLAGEEETSSQLLELVFASDNSRAEDSNIPKTKETPIPKGVKKISIELDETEVAQNPQLASDIREQFPWATIEGKPGPNISRKRNTATDDHLSTPSLTGLRPNISEVSIAGTEDVSKTLSTGMTNEPSLASQNSQSEPNPHEEVDPDLQVDDAPPYLGTRRKRQPLEAQITSTLSAETIPERAQALGIELNRTVRELISNAYSQWRVNEEIGPFNKKKAQLQDFYKSLVVLYILGHKEQENELCYAVLLRFQSTNCHETKGFPKIETVILAFEHLSTISPLCEWIAILYSFLWGTEQSGKYEKFITEHPKLDPLAFSKLLYSIAFIRCPYIEGYDFAVLTDWCKVHGHTGDDSTELTLCSKTWKSLNGKCQQLAAEQNAKKLEEVINDLKEFGDQASMDQLNEHFRSRSSPNKGKRKADNLLARSFKNNRRGRGRGRSG